MALLITDRRNAKAAAALNSEKQKDQEVDTELKNMSESWSSLITNQQRAAKSSAAL
jgi:hypothetical protein